MEFPLTDSKSPEVENLPILRHSKPPAPEQAYDGGVQSLSVSDEIFFKHFLFIRNLPQLF